MPKRDKHKKHPAEVNPSAHFSGELSAQEPMPETIPVLSSSVSEYMSAIGRKGGKIGGKRRLKTLSAKERKKLAANAARARWNKSK